MAMEVGRKKLLAINGSYREGGIIDQAVAAALDAAAVRGYETEEIFLREWEIRFCTNCRACTQEPGEAPGRCVQDDAMREIIEKIESCDAILLASPTNFSSVTALFKRFMERLVAYGYWPWGEPMPRNRKSKPTKKALLVSSSAMPGLLARLFTCSLRLLKLCAKTVGAKPSGSLYIGMIAAEKYPALPPKMREKARRLIDTLN
jgi:multimeric flavodoxin WrbA